MVQPLPLISPSLTTLVGYRCHQMSWKDGSFVLQPRTVSTTRPPVFACTLKLLVNALDSKEFNVDLMENRVLNAEQACLTNYNN